MQNPILNELIGNWKPLFHTLLVGTLSYIGTIVWLRISGKRTLSKWNSFDFVVTVAFGSILASALLTDTISFLQAMLAIGLLVSYQFVLTWLSVRTEKVQALIKAKPTLLLFKGAILNGMAKRKRVAEGEILAAVRLNGYSKLEDVDAVVLETDGSFSVIGNIDPHDASAMRDVEGFSR